MQPNQPTGQGFPGPTPGPADNPNLQNQPPANFQPAQQVPTTPQPGIPAQPSFAPPQPQGGGLAGVPGQANPMQPQQFPPNSGGMGSMNGQLGGKSPLNALIPKLKFIIPIVVLVLIVLVGAFFAKSMLFDGSKLKKSDLVEQKIGSTTIMGPKQWQSSDARLGDLDDVYTKGGISKETEGKDSPLIYGVKTDDIGYDFDTELSAEQQKLIGDYIRDSLPAEVEQGFKSNSGGEDSEGYCGDVKDVAANHVPSSEFTMNIVVTATCTKDEKTIKLYMVAAIKHNTAYTLVVAGLGDYWQSNQEVIDEMIGSFKPAD